MRTAWSTARKLLFWCHLAVGLTVSAWVLFMAATGTLIAFQSEIVSVAERQYQVPQARQAECDTASLALHTAEAEAARGATAVILFRDPRQPAEVQFGRSEVWLLHPCTGSVILARSPIRAFVRSVLELHYAVSFQGQPHPRLRQLKAAADLAFVFLLISGLLLWLPRVWRLKNIQAVLLLRPNAKGRAREWNLHHVFGIWLALPLLVISMTGAVLAYPWVRDVLYRSAGEMPPALNKAEPPIKRRPADTLTAEMDNIVQRTAQAVPGWQRMEVTLPPAEVRTIAVVVDTGHIGRPQQRVRVLMNLAGGPAKITRFRDEPRGRQWTLVARYLHTGELFGVVGKSIAFLAGCGAFVLVWTGLALSWRRWLRSIRRVG